MTTPLSRPKRLRRLARQLENEAYYFVDQSTQLGPKLSNTLLSTAYLLRNHADELEAPKQPLGGPINWTHVP